MTTRYPPSVLREVSAEASKRLTAVALALQTLMALQTTDERKTK